jgi:shikimate dehydrogenase
MEKTGEKEIYGLIGYPVKHSFSPAMHSAAFDHLGMSAQYVLFEVPPDGLADFFKKTIPEKKIKGFNITVPYKGKAVAFLNASVSQSVRMNQAVNTVRVEKDGSLSGINSDGVGFSIDLKNHGFDATEKKIALLGAGGAAKAVATSLAVNRPTSLLVFDVDAAKAEDLCQIIKNFFPAVAVAAVSSCEALRIPEADLLINATPVGMKEADPLLVPQEALHQALFVYDLIYNPSETPLLKAAKEAGCKTANGLGMLLHQGCLAFEYWTGKDAPVGVMRKALLEQLYV